jgi:hypothetical protein
MLKFKDFYEKIILILLGFNISKILQKHASKSKLILQWNEFCYHIHHWITFSILILITYNLVLPSYTKKILIYFFIGIILENFTFHGIFKIKEKCSIMEF